MFHTLTYKDFEMKAIPIYLERITAHGGIIHNVRTRRSPSGSWDAFVDVEGLETERHYGETARHEGSVFLMKPRRYPDTLEDRVDTLEDRIQRLEGMAY